MGGGELRGVTFVEASVHGVVVRLDVATAANHRQIRALLMTALQPRATVTCVKSRLFDLSLFAASRFVISLQSPVPIVTVFNVCAATFGSRCCSETCPGDLSRSEELAQGNSDTIDGYWSPWHSNCAREGVDSTVLPGTQQHAQDEVKCIK